MNEVERFYVDFNKKKFVKSDVGGCMYYSPYEALEKRLHDLEDAIKSVAQYRHHEYEIEFYVDPTNFNDQPHQIFYQAIKNSEARQT